MTNAFSVKDPVRCRHYARFMSHLTLTEANLVFWLLFIVVLILLCISSIQHHKSVALNRDKDLPSPGKIRHLRFRYLLIACLCFVLSLTCIVMECFAIFNIGYCHGEDLIQLYWAFWVTWQVGSCIAILGVMIAFWIVLGDVETPSWAVGLGTPVLVFAGLGFIVRDLWRKALRRYVVVPDDNNVSRDAERVEGGEGDTDQRASQAPTIVPEEASTGDKPEE